MNEKIKFLGFGFAAGLIFAFIFATGWTICSGRGLSSPRGIPAIDQANQREAAETIQGLRGTTDSLGNRIVELEGTTNTIEAINNRLESHIGNARDISGELGKSAETMGTDIDGAIELYQRIADKD